MKEIILLSILCLLVLAFNASVISFNLIYQEQSLLYVANQSIHSFSDFLNLYLNPQMLHLKIPFFRPSGNFLLYQLLMPLLGWHNNQALIVVNLLFLALTGFFMIKLYQLLFPNYKAGGYIAFALYAMHPALILPRLMTLHLEYAYVFFVILSLYCFFRSTQSTTRQNALLISSLIFYALAVTFKESALMLGPVLILCLVMQEWKKAEKYKLKGGTGYSFPRAACEHGNEYPVTGPLLNKKLLQMLALIAILTLSLALYLTMPWASIHHPLGNAVDAGQRILAAKQFLKTIFALRYGPLSPTYDLYNIFPPITRMIIWLMWILVLAASLRVFIKKAPYRSAILFLFLSAVLFMVMPLVWAMGWSWHLSLSLIFISLIMGFSCDYILMNLHSNYPLGLLIALLIGFSTLNVNHANIEYRKSQGNLALQLRSNALFHPPALKGLNEESIIVVEDGILHDPYLLGASTYPYPYPIPMFRKQNSDVTDWARFSELQQGFFMKYDPIYNGSLMRWAYLMPNVREEEYPFSVTQMATVPNEILYNWLRHADNIFCIGYDQNGNWQDHTEIFKRNLMREKIKRKLTVYQYDRLPLTALKGNLSLSKILPVPDIQSCQLDCDQDKGCRGSVYENVEYGSHPGIKCHFYDYLMQNQDQFCATCIGFVKQKKLG